MLYQVVLQKARHLPLILNNLIKEGDLFVFFYNNDYFGYFFNWKRYFFFNK